MDYYIHALGSIKYGQAYNGSPGCWFNPEPFQEGLRSWLFHLFSFFMVSLLFKIGLLALFPEFYVQNFYLPKLYGILEVGAMVNFRFLESKLLLEF